MVSTEIATQSVYHGGFEAPFEEKVERFVKKVSGNETLILNKKHLYLT